MERRRHGTGNCIPDPDPGVLFLQDMNVQLFGLNGTPGDGVPTMNGFADNYAQQNVNDPTPDPMSVLHFFTPQQVPVISQLAKSFGVSDQWHALGAMSDLAESVFRAYRYRRRLRRQLARSFSLFDAEHIQVTERQWKNLEGLFSRSASGPKAHSQALHPLSGLSRPTRSLQLV